MNKALVIAALFGGIEAVRLNFASGMQDTEQYDASDDFEADRERTYAMLTAQEGSGVRAKWVELPDCPNNGPLPSGTIVLMPDLSNAIIATCKHYTWVQPPAPPPAPDNAGAGDTGTPPPPPAGDAGTPPADPNANPEEDPNAGPIQEPEYIPPQIYDPVMHKLGDSVASGSSIPTTEHQITQHAQGTVDNAMADTNGPKGDWHVETGYHDHNAGTQWAALPEENLTTNMVPKDQIVGATFGQNDVTDVVKTAYANGKRAFKADDSIFVDPKPDVRKGLTIRWIHNGETGFAVSTKGDGKVLDVPNGIPAAVVANGGQDTTAGAADAATDSAAATF